MVRTKTVGGSPGGRGAAPIVLAAFRCTAGLTPPLAGEFGAVPGLSAPGFWLGTSTNEGSDAGR